LLKQGLPIIDKTSKRDQIDFYVGPISCKYKGWEDLGNNIRIDMVNEGRYGWIWNTCAKDAYFVMWGANMVYVLDIKRMRDYIKSNKNTLVKSDRGCSCQGDYGYEIPVSDMRMNSLIKAEYFI